jgi:glutaredoxin
MSKYFIKAILLEDCHYSESAKQLLNENNIKSEIIIISRNEKELYKTKNIITYPQIYLKKESKIGDLLLGGYSDLKNAFDIFKNKVYDINNINIFMEKYNWSKKATLRLIELLNIIEKN